MILKSSNVKNEIKLALVTNDAKPVLYIVVREWVQLSPEQGT